MSDDLLARLRGRANADWRGYPPDAIYADAADRIEQLEAERDALRKALTEWGHYSTCELGGWLAHAPLDSSQAPSCDCPLSALLDPEDGDR